MSPNSHILTLAAAAIFALCLALGGCSGGADSAFPGSSPLPASAAAGAFDADIDTLATVLPRAIEAMHWGRMRITSETTALSASALTPDDRPVEIRAQAGDGSTAVQVTVGYFGDEQLEREFLRALDAEIVKWRAKHKRLAP